MSRLVRLCALLLSLGCMTLAQPPITTANPEPAAPASPPDEGPTRCHGENFPIPKGESPSCCQLGKDIYQVFGQPGQEGVGHRHLGRPCSDAQENPNCIGMECYYGACGASNPVPPSPWNGTTSEVFVPVSQPRACGYQVKNGDKVVVSNPEDRISLPNRNETASRPKP
jgi:hypothetical protein